MVKKKRRKTLNSGLRWKRTQVTMDEKQDIEEEIQKAIIDVTTILKDSKKARENDLWLCIQFWRLHGIRVYVNYQDLDSMTTPESITRARRIVQNEMHLYLPENPSVLVRRRVKEEVMRNYFRGDQKIINEWERLRNKKNKTEGGANETEKTD